MLSESEASNVTACHEKGPLTCHAERSEASTWARPPAWSPRMLRCAPHDTKMAWALTVRDEALLPFKGPLEVFDRFVNQAALFQQLPVAGQLIG